MNLIHGLWNEGIWVSGEKKISTNILFSKPSSDASICVNIPCGSVWHVYQLRALTYWYKTSNPFCHSPGLTLSVLMVCCMFFGRGYCWWPHDESWDCSLQCLQRVCSCITQFRSAALKISWSHKRKTSKIWHI